MQIINLTPHTINLNSGASYEASGTVARVTSNMEETGNIEGIPVYSQTFGDIEGLPEPSQDVIYIVSSIVKAATIRKDVVAPATSHQDVIRNEKGHIVSVPGFIS